MFGMSRIGALTAIFDQEFEGVGRRSGAQTNPAACAGGFDPVAHQTLQGHARLLDVDKQTRCVLDLGRFETHLPMRRELVQRQQSFASEHLRFDKLPLRPGRTCKLHQFGQELVDALHLGDDLVQRLLACRFRFMTEQILRLPGKSRPGDY